MAATTTAATLILRMVAQAHGEANPYAHSVVARAHGRTNPRVTENGGCRRAKMRQRVCSTAACRCILHDNQLVWEYCDVGPPSPEPCPNPPPPIKHNHTVLQFGKWHGDSVYEHRYNYYRVHVPAGCLGVQLVVVPTSGNPDMYISFDQPFPTGHSYSYAQKGATVDVFRITRDTPGFCGELGKQSECDIYVSVAGYETARFHLIAYNLTSPNASSSCSNDCNWPDLGERSPPA